jgi:SAM-dependent methyltransferase
MTFVNKEQAEFWSERATTWTKVDDRLEAVSGLPGRLAMERLDLRSGQQVVDLGCGTGHTTLQLAELVAPDGKAIGADIAEGMLEAARRRAGERGVKNVEFRHVDVQSSDLGEEAFDAAYSRFGVMFYADPVAAFKNVHSALKPGGSLSFVCWMPLDKNEWMLLPGMTAVTVTGQMPEMPGPDQPGPFSLADPEKVTGILGRAGFKEIDIEPHEDTATIAENDIDVMSEISTRVGAVNEIIRAAGEEMREPVRAAIANAYRERAVDGEVRMSRGVLLLRASA